MCVYVCEWERERWDKVLYSLVEIFENLGMVLGIFLYSSDVFIFQRGNIFSNIKLFIPKSYQSLPKDQKQEIV